MKKYTIILLCTTLLACMSFLYTTTYGQSSPIAQENTEQHQQFHLDQLLATYGINESDEGVRKFFSIAVAHHRQMQTDQQKLHEDLTLIAEGYHSSSHNDYHLYNGAAGSDSGFWIATSIGAGIIVICWLGSVLSTITEQDEVQRDLRAFKKQTQNLQAELEQIHKGLEQEYQKHSAKNVHK